MDTNNYELMLAAVVDRADQLLSRIEKSLKDSNASNVSVDRLGKKTLAYTIKKQTDATYFAVSFEASGEAIKPVWEKLKLEQEDLLRFLLIKKQNKKKKGRRGRVPEVSKVSEVSDVSQADKEKPKVTVAVKQASKVKSDEKEVSKGLKVSKVKKGVKSTKSKKGKSKK